MLEVSPDAIFLLFSENNFNIRLQPHIFADLFIKTKVPTQHVVFYCTIMQQEVNVNIIITLNHRKTGFRLVKLPDFIIVTSTNLTALK